MEKNKNSILKHFLVKYDIYRANLPANLFLWFWICAAERKTHSSARRHLRVSMVKLQKKLKKKKVYVYNPSPQQKNKQTPNHSGPGPGTFKKGFGELLVIQRSAAVCPRRDPVRAEEDHNARRGRRKRGRGERSRAFSWGRSDGVDRSAHWRNVFTKSQICPLP